jgi:hypothetical protein
VEQYKNTALKKYLRFWYKNRIRNESSLHLENGVDLLIGSVADPDHWVGSGSYPAFQKCFFTYVGSVGMFYNLLTVPTQNKKSYIKHIQLL